MMRNSDCALYDAVAQSLRELASDVVAAECHGMLCGMLCSPEAFDGDVWLRYVLGYTPVQRLAELPQTHALLTLVGTTLRALRDDTQFGFQLLLPDEEAALAVRASALAAWCRGFLSGFGLHAVGAELREEGREFLCDLYKIGQIGPQDATGEDSERAFFEICEYARMGAIMLYEESRGPLDDAPPSLH